jgi:hypothetical protein
MDSEERDKVLFTVLPEVIQAARKKIIGCEECSKDAEVPLSTSYRRNHQYDPTPETTERRSHRGHDSITFWLRQDRQTRLAARKMADVWAGRERRSMRQSC